MEIIVAQLTKKEKNKQFHSQSTILQPHNNVQTTSHAQLIMSLVVTSCRNS